MPSRVAACLILPLALSACAAFEESLGLEPGAEAPSQADAVAAGEEPAEPAPTLADVLDRLSGLELALTGVETQVEATASTQQEALATLHSDYSNLAGEVKQLREVRSEPPPPPACPETENPLGDKQLVGRKENVWFEGFKLALPARIDTGAETASLDARNIEEFERNGEEWVRFEVPHPESGELLPLERRVERVVRIIQSTSDEGERRNVVKLDVTVGRVRQMAEFTLSNRSHLDFEVLIGRNVLRDLMVVDVGRTNIAPYQPAANDVAMPE